MVNGRTHWPYTAAEGGRGRDIGEQWVSKLTGVERGKGKEQKTQEGTLVKEKGGLSFLVYTSLTSKVDKRGKVKRQIDN